MSHARWMMETNPTPALADPLALVECIEACVDCAQACSACADACLGEEEIQMLTRCIRLNLDCTDLCEATGKILSRQTDLEPVVVHIALRACAQACRLCGEECENHAEHHEPCRVCAEVCRRCEMACSNLLSAMRA